MTNLNKPVKRVTSGQIREAGAVRNVIVIMRPPNILGFKAKGCRREYQLTVEACYIMAVRASVSMAKKEKLAAKKSNAK
jgi:hypothetical protein